MAGHLLNYLLMLNAYCCCVLEVYMVGEYWCSSEVTNHRRVERGRISGQTGDHSVTGLVTAVWDRDSD